MKFVLVLFSLGFFSSVAVAGTTHHVAQEAQKAYSTAHVAHAAYKKDHAKVLKTSSVSGSIYEAAIEGDIVKLQQLLKVKNLSVNVKSFKNYTLLHLASEYGQPNVVKFLLENGAVVDPRRSGNTPLHLASITGAIRVIPILIEYGANVRALTYSRVTPLHYASKYGHLKAAIMLVESGADVNARTKGFAMIGGNTPLGLAMDANHADVVEYLKSKGAVE